eukprot:5690031-Amphidinium_carterae.1
MKANSKDSRAALESKPIGFEQANISPTTCEHGRVLCGIGEHLKLAVLRTNSLVVVVFAVFFESDQLSP